MTSRTVQKKIDQNDWRTVKLQELTKGDVFRMFEPDGRPVHDNMRLTEWIAASEPYQFSHATNKSGEEISGPVWGIEIVTNPGF